jgi:DNA polymerase-3 subunit delta
MRPQEAIQAIKKGQAKPFILLTGEDDDRKKTTLQKMIDALGIELPEINLSIFEERPDPQAVLRAMETLPFSGGKRLTVLKNTDILGAQASGDWSAPFCHANMPQGNYFVVSAQGNADKRKAFVKFVTKTGMVVDCNPLKEAEMVEYVIRFAKQCNLLISRKNAQTLVELADGKLSFVRNELEKLTCVSRGEITASDLEKYTVKSMEYNIFKIHDFMVAGYPQHARKLIDRMLEEDKTPIGFLSLIAGNFRQMLVARACRDAKFPDSKTIRHIMEATGAREFAARRAIEQCKRFTANQIRRAIEKLAQMDFDAKQGVIVLQTDLYALLVDIYCTKTMH